MTAARPQPAVRRVVYIVTFLGLVAAGAATVMAKHEPLADWRRWAAAILVAMVGDMALVRIRRGGSQRSHNWRETALLIGFVLLPPGQLVFAMLAAEVLALVIHRMSVPKIAFNLGLVAVEATLGAVIVVGAHPYHAQPFWHAVYEPATLLVLLLASAVSPLASTLFVSVIVSAERSRGIRSCIVDAAPTAVAVWARNAGAAVVLIAAADWSLALAVGAVVVLLGVHFFSADRTAIRQERFAWHRLQEAIDQLRDVELNDLISDATAAAATMMRADAAEIQLYARTGYATVLRASDIEDAHTPDAAEGSPGHSMDVALSTREGKIGELRLLFTQPVKLSDTENDCLTAFANALAVALANALKFDAIREDAYRRIRAAYVDPVTGVGNLMMLEEEARSTLPDSRDGNVAAVAVIGLNRFAEVNDLLGAHAADQMLRAVATRLSSVVRRCDVVARLHGAEYVLLLRELQSEQAAEAQAELAVRALGTAITADGLDLTVDAHTGVACAPTDGPELDDLVRRARLAMYKARSEDVPVFRYRAELEPPALAQVELLRDLREALRDRQLILHFQPKFSLRGGHPIAAEALVRWQHPQRGMIPPAEFIPLLERCGLVGDLTRYVLEGSIAECAEWHRLGLPLSVAVNLSARNLLDEDLPRFVLECLARHKLPTDRLICEITETAVFSRSPIAASVLDQLRAAGVELSLDDFCTGYSSLSLLRERTIDEIKIDRSFVADLGVEPRATQIVTTLIELAHRCDITVTAEGIETPEQQQLLTTLGCDHAQGYLLARPMPADAVRLFFVESLRDAPVTPLPRQGRPRIRPVTHIANWEDPDAWAEASSE
jgi:diguanylate cyclase (GGDEF)-like protein